MGINGWGRSGVKKWISLFKVTLIKTSHRGHMYQVGNKCSHSLLGGQWEGIPIETVHTISQVQTHTLKAVLIYSLGLFWSMVIHLFIIHSLIQVSIHSFIPFIYPESPVQIDFPFQLWLGKTGFKDQNLGPAQLESWTKSKPKSGSHRHQRSKAEGNFRESG